MIGMTEERLKQLEDNPILRPAALEEIWAEMIRYRKRLHEIRQAHYLIYDWEYSESVGDRTPEEAQQHRDYLAAIGVGLKEEG